MFSWGSGVVIGAFLDNPRALSDDNGGQFAQFDVPLSAGETITTSQDSGTNSEFNMWARVQESPL